MINWYWSFIWYKLILCNILGAPWTMDYTCFIQLCIITCQVLIVWSHVSTHIQINIWLKTKFWVVHFWSFKLPAQNRIAILPIRKPDNITSWTFAKLVTVLSIALSNCNIHYTSKTLLNLSSNISSQISEEMPWILILFLLVYCPRLLPEVSISVRSFSNDYTDRLSSFRASIIVPLMPIIFSFIWSTILFFKL